MRSSPVLLLALVLLPGCEHRPAPSPIAPDPPRPPPVPAEVLIETPRAPAALAASSDLAPRLPDECTPGESRVCGPVALMPNPSQPLTMRCARAPAGNFVFDRSSCNTPLVVAFDGDRVSFGAPAGTFTIGSSARTEWPSSRTPWLAHDRDGSGCVEDERELLGPAADPTGRARSGFDALALLDDDGDGRIDRRDAAFARLALWFDRDRDRRCIPEEMVPVERAGIVAIELAASPARPPERAGSFEGETALVTARGPDGSARRARVVDVYLAPLGER